MKCISCGKDSLLIGKSMKCNYCFNTNALTKHKEWFRVCWFCFDLKVVSTSYKASKHKCGTCVVKYRKSPPTIKKVCPACGNVRHSPGKNKTQYCIKCASKHTKTKQILHRICQRCGDDKIVHTKYAAQRKHCRECANYLTTLTIHGNAKKVVKKKRKKEKTYSKVGTDGAERNKVNVSFKNPIFNRKTDEEFPKLEREKELAMQKKWLKENNMI